MFRNSIQGLSCQVQSEPANELYTSEDGVQCLKRCNMDVWKTACLQYDFSFFG